MAGTGIAVDDHAVRVMGVLIFKIGLCSRLEHQHDKCVIGVFVVILKEIRKLGFAFVFGQRPPAIHDFVVIPNHVLREPAIDIAQMFKLPINPVIGAIKLGEILNDRWFIQIAIGFAIFCQQCILVIL